jgi:hypothetical protein
MLITFSLSACKKLDLAPANRFTEANYWTTTDKANNVLNTAYSQMSKAIISFRWKRCLIMLTMAVAITVVLHRLLQALMMHRLGR